MSSPLPTSVSIVGYLFLFAGVGLVFVFVNLLLGWLVRPSNPHDEKLEIYECGEPTIGSSFVQFDLRFYVVALVFIIFDVEVAFLFPWATVFGKTTNMIESIGGPNDVLVATADEGLRYSDEMTALQRELGVRNPEPPRSTSVAEARATIATGTRMLSGLSVVAVMIFFVVLLIGFAYEWRTGALDWVRAIGEEHGRIVTADSPVKLADQESILSA